MAFFKRPYKIDLDTKRLKYIFTGLTFEQAQEKYPGKVEDFYDKYFVKRWTCAGGFHPQKMKKFKEEYEKHFNIKNP